MALSEIILGTLQLPLRACELITSILTDVFSYNCSIVEAVVSTLQTVSGYLWTLVLYVGAAITVIFDELSGLLAEVWKYITLLWCVVIKFCASIKDIAIELVFLLEYFRSFMEVIGFLTHQLLCAICYVLYLPVFVLQNTFNECLNVLYCISYGLKYISDTLTAIGTVFSQILDIDIWSYMIDLIKIMTYRAMDKCFIAYSEAMRTLNYFANNFIPNVSKYTYIGAVVCVIGYYVLLRTVKYMKSRRFFSFYFDDLFRRRRNAAREHFADRLRDENVANERVDDSEDEYTVNNDSDTEMSTGSSATDSEENEFVSDRSDDSRDTDSDASIQIDVLGPPSDTNGGGSRYNLRSRSNTPSQKSFTDEKKFHYEMERERDKRVCVICQQTRKDVLVLPCRHMCMCLKCAEHVVSSPVATRRVCPLCRGRIDKIMQVYV